MHSQDGMKSMEKRRQLYVIKIKGLQFKVFDQPVTLKSTIKAGMYFFFKKKKERKVV
jgi:hypothetical protein